MAQTDFNLIAYARAIGSRDASIFTIGETIQPTLIVGDLSRLTPAHQPPVAMFGGFMPGNALELTVWEVQSLAAGGTWVVNMAATPIFGFTFEIRPAVTALNNVVVCIPQVLSNTAPTSNVRHGSLILAPPALDDVPSFGSGSWIDREIWIPPGQFMYCQSKVFNAAGDLALLVRDVPVGEGGE